jgi:hypothetical protein
VESITEVSMTPQSQRGVNDTTESKTCHIANTKNKATGRN